MKHRDDKLLSCSLVCQQLLQNHVKPFYIHLLLHCVFDSLFIYHGLVDFQWLSKMAQIPAPSPMQPIFSPLEAWVRRFLLRGPELSPLTHDDQKRLKVSWDNQLTGNGTINHTHIYIYSSWDAFYIHIYSYTSLNIHICIYTYMYTYLYLYSWDTFWESNVAIERYHFIPDIPVNPYQKILLTIH